MKLVYNVNEKPPIKKNLVYAFQQLLAIIAATLLVPTLVNLYNDAGMPNVLNQPAALFGAGAGTLFYLLVTKFRSPAFLGSSFAFITPLCGAAVFGRLGIFLGAVFAGLVYVVIALVIKKTGSGWVNKLLPPVVIGPTVALIGFSLCGSAVNNINNTASGSYNLVAILVGLVAFFATVFVSIKGGKGVRMIPFIIGIGVAYVFAAILTGIGAALNCDVLKIIDFSPFKGIGLFEVPDFTFLSIFRGTTDANGNNLTVQSFADVMQIFILFAPVAFVVLAEHIADHKNLGSIIERDLITDPGLDRTHIGDGVGSIIGSFFGGCPNTTYGESVACVALTGNASWTTIALAAVYCIVLSFFKPFVAFVNTIPTCIVGGICIALYGFIAVSGLKMVQTVDLNDNRNLYTVCAILVPGIGGLTLNFGAITLTSIATALILGILVNQIFGAKAAKETK